MIVSLVKKILKFVSFLFISNKPGSFDKSSRFIYIWCQKLSMCSYPIYFTPALMKFISDSGIIFICESTSSIVWLGMEWHTFDIIILLVGLRRLRMGIMCSFNFSILCDFSIRELNNCSLDKKTHTRPMDIFETNIMLLGEIICPIPII